MLPNAWWPLVWWCWGANLFSFPWGKTKSGLKECAFLGHKCCLVVLARTCARVGLDFPEPKANTQRGGNKPPPGQPNLFPNPNPSTKEDATSNHLTHHFFQTTVPDHCSRPLFQTAVPDTCSKPLWQTTVPGVWVWKQLVGQVV